MNWVIREVSRAANSYRRMHELPRSSGIGRVEDFGGVRKDVSAILDVGVLGERD